MSKKYSENDFSHDTNEFYLEVVHFIKFCHEKFDKIIGPGSTTQKIDNSKGLRNIVISLTHRLEDLCNAAEQFYDKTHQFSLFSKSAKVRVRRNLYVVNNEIQLMLLRQCYIELTPKAQGINRMCLLNVYPKEELFEEPTIPLELKECYKELLIARAVFSKILECRCQKFDDDLVANHDLQFISFAKGKRAVIAKQIKEQMVSSDDDIDAVKELLLANFDETLVDIVETYFDDPVAIYNQLRMIEFKQEDMNTIFDIQLHLQMIAQRNLQSSRYPSIDRYMKECSKYENSCIKQFVFNSMFYYITIGWMHKKIDDSDNINIIMATFLALMMRQKRFIMKIPYETAIMEFPNMKTIITRETYYDKLGSKCNVPQKDIDDVYDDFMEFIRPFLDLWN